MSYEYDSFFEEIMGNIYFPYKIYTYCKNCETFYEVTLEISKSDIKHLFVECPLCRNKIYVFSSNFFDIIKNVLIDKKIETTTYIGWFFSKEKLEDYLFEYKL